MMRNHVGSGRGRQGSRALVVGLGRFGGGVAATRYLLQEGAFVRVADHAPPDSLGASVAAVGQHDRLEWCLGRNDTDLLTGVDLLVANPAVPQESPLLGAARLQGIPITQEINLFLDAYPGEVVLVSGTNGKSTTATLLAAALGGSRPVLLGGNIGRSLLAQRQEWHPGQVAVVEISSFQLERIDLQRHRVRGTVLTRVTEDHLDRHGTLAAYHAAKARAAAVADGFLVHAGSDVVAQQMPSPARHRLTFDTDEPWRTFGVRDGWLWSLHPRDPGPIAHPSALSLTGDFQRENVLAAAAAALELGVSRHDAGYRLCLVKPLRHRLQLVGRHLGIRIYDNGVSTQADSTLSALGNVPGPVHWVGGGKNKGQDLRRLVPALASRMASAHLFGAIADEMAAALGELAPALPATRHDHLESALDTALAQARPGDAVLFSPAFSSYDQFVNFEARAARFHDWLRLLGETGRSGGNGKSQAGGDPGPG